MIYTLLTLSRAVKVWREMFVNWDPRNVLVCLLFAALIYNLNNPNNPDHLNNLSWRANMALITLTVFYLAVWYLFAKPVGTLANNPDLYSFL